MVPVWSDFRERREHESTLVEPRVWQDKRGGLGHLTIVIEEIEIKHARRVSLATHTAKLSFDHLEHREEVSRGETGCQ